MTTVTELGLTQLESGYIDYLWLIFLCTMLVDGIALVTSVGFTGKSRECCYESSHDSCCSPCMQILVGPVVQFFLFLALCATFIVHLPVLTAIACIWGVLIVIDDACVVGEHGLQGLGQLLVHSGFTAEYSVTHNVTHNVTHDVTHDPAAADVLQILDKALPEFCALPDTTTWAATIIIAGTIMCLIAQSELLVFTYANLMRVWPLTLEEPVEEDEKRPLL